jgi:ABC-2 type transport system ATP-binding protein
MQKNVLLEFKNILKIFNSTTILSNFNLKIYEHEIVALLGKSGCGKSTFIKILLGAYDINQGEILYQGKRMNQNREELSKIIGYVSQENSFYSKLTVEENLRFFGNMYDVPKKELNHRISELLTFVKLDLSRDILAEKLSGGMKRRLEFAISLIHNPHILILDEPFAGLDIEIRDELWKLLEKIRDSDVTIIIVTHLLLSTQKYANRALILHKKNIKKEIDFTHSRTINLDEEFKKVVRL